MNAGLVPFVVVFYSLFIEEVEGLGLLRWELGEGAAPLHQAPRSVVLHIGLGFGLLYGWRAGGGAKQSAEAAGGEVTDSHRGEGGSWEETGEEKKKKNAGTEQCTGVTNAPHSQGGMKSEE